MAKLKCPNCGNSFDKKAIVEYGSAGASAMRVGAGVSLPVSPFILRVHAQSAPSARKQVGSKSFHHGTDAEALDAPILPKLKKLRVNHVLNCQ